MNIIGIDLGTSITKVIEVDKDDNILNKMILNEKDLKTVFNIFVNSNNIDKNNIGRVVLTGVGAKDLEEIEGIQTAKIDEFIAIGEGGKKLSKKEEAIVISVGTGTAFVKIENDKIEHLGGTGVGGRTLENLCNIMANTNSLDEILDLSKNGDLNNIDLKIKDISKEDIPNLPSNITACNFGKVNNNNNNNATKEDLVAGIINMVFEIIGVMAGFLSKSTNTKDVILIGSLFNKIDINETLEEIELLHNIKFLIPKNAEFGTAIGAIEYYKKSI